QPCPRIQSTQIRRTPRTTLVSYTTLFRSLNERQPACGLSFFCRSLTQLLGEELAHVLECLEFQGIATGIEQEHGGLFTHLTLDRSEEHTSELQSRENLVWRLLLEKNRKQ